MPKEYLLKFILIQDRALTSINILSTDSWHLTDFQPPALRWSDHDELLTRLQNARSTQSLEFTSVFTTRNDS